MERLQKALIWAAAVSEISHVFCCVLPTIASLLSLLAGLGLITVLPAGFMVLHELIHQYEVPVIIFSGMMLLLGWGLHGLSVRLDCRNTGCCHEPCKPAKRKASKILLIATGLFLLNLTVYAAVHIPLERSAYRTITRPPGDH